MARYSGAVCRLCRRQGEKLFLRGNHCLTPKCSFYRVPIRPGHRPVRRRKVSVQGMQLREKQRAQASYGVLEKHFVRYYKEAIKRPGISGENLVRLLESRLDNVVYRLGFADSRSQARQVIRHGLIAVNGQKLEDPSAQATVGDEVSFTPRGIRSVSFQSAQAAAKSRTVPRWLTLDLVNMSGRVTGPPAVSAGETHLFNEGVIIEYYSR